KDERGIVIKNKVRLVAQGHTQEERIDYDKVFVPVARIEAIRLFLAYASFMGFTVYQIDVKSAFLYGTIDKEVEFEALMHEKFQMSAMDELTFFLVKRIFRYLKGHPKLGLWYPKESLFDLVAYSDSDYGGADQDRKSTIGGCQFLGRSNTITVRLQLCDYHNMVAILEKSEHNIDFHPMIDFIEASPLRRNLKLKDEEGIGSLPDTELFENLTLMGYNISPNQKFTFQKRFNEFSSNIATALVCLATNRTYNFSKMIFDGLVKNVNNKGEGSGTPTEPHHTPSPEAQPPSHTTHSSSSLPPSFALPTVADEPKSPLRDISQREACPTDSRFIADQDRETIAKSSTLTHNSAPRVTSPAADEGNMKMMPQSRRRSLDEGEAAAERISDDSEEMKTILTSMDATTVLVGGIADVPTGSRSIPTASPPADEVPTGSDVVPTASPVFATATVITPCRRRKGKEVMVESETPKKQRFQEQIDAQVARELEEQLEREDQRRSEQIARDAEIVRIHVEEELQIMIDGLDRNNETIAKYLQEYHQFASELPMERRIKLISDLVKSNLGYKVKYFRGMTFEEAEAKFNSVWKQLEDFIPMGSKEEAERIKRKGLSLEQESAKKQKISEEVTEEAKSSDEVPKEKVKEMMQLVPIEEVYVEALQVKHQIIDWKVYHEGQRSYLKNTRLYEPDHEDQLWTHTQNFMHAPVEWKLYESCGVHHVTSKDKEIFMLVEKDYPLRKGLALVMIGYNLQVENYSQMANDLILKIYKIANSLRQQVIEFPLAEEIPTASEESCHCQKKSEATVVKIALLLKSDNNIRRSSINSFQQDRVFLEWSLQLWVSKSVSCLYQEHMQSKIDPSDTLVLEVLGLDLVWQEK
nr:copia protein [Tanacetum cinerariifolium]